MKLSNGKPLSDYLLDKEFWDAIRNQHDYNDFEIYIVTKLICGEDLSNFDENKVFRLIFNMALTNEMSEKELKTRIKKFNQSISLFLEKLRDIFSSAESKSQIVYKKNIELLERSLNLPQFGSEYDSDEVLDFIRSLEDDFYSFSEAARLLGVTRQTLTKYAKEAAMGLTTVQIKKSAYLTKESIASFYRVQWEKKHGSWVDRLPY